MNPSAVIDWPSALAVLALGLAAGGILLWRTRRAPAPPPATALLDQRDLEARRDALLQQLRELEDTASKRTPEQLARERYTLELAAAQAMRDLEPPVAAGARPRGRAGGSVAGATAAGAAVVATPDRGAVRGFLWGTATASAVGLLLFFVSRASAPREEGGSLTGTVGRLSSTPNAVAPAAGADDIETHLVQAREHLARQDLMGVWNDTQFVLQREPGNPRALSYQALVRLAMGQADVAESMLKRALAAAPGLIDAHLHLAVVYARTGRMAEAEATLRAARSQFPQHREGLDRLMQQITQEGPAEGTDPAATGAHAEVAPSDDVPASQPGLPARLSGVVELDRSAQARSAGGGIVFVTVRAAGVTTGPPVAVKRFPASTLPGAFAITTADSMLGQELPGRVRIEARLEPDGDPLTRAATDPAARLEDVKLGSTGLRLVLK